MTTLASALHGGIDRRQSARTSTVGGPVAGSDSVVVLDSSGRVIMGTFWVLGTPVPIGTVAELVGGQEADPLIACIEAVLATGATTEVEYRIERGGQSSWYAATVTRLDADAVTWHARDISRMKRAEEELLRWKERHLALVDSFDVILWESKADISDGFTFVSAQAERLLGYPTERWLADPAFWADHIHPDDREWCVDYSRSKAANNEDHDFEYRMTASDGRVVWLRGIVTVVTEEGVPVALRGVMVDITDIKETERKLARKEEQYRSIFESTSDGLLINDLETGGILAANPALCQMYGFDDMVGLQASAIVNGESELVMGRYLEAARIGTEFRGRATAVRKNGSTFDVELLGRRFEFEGRPAVLGVVREVTEQVRTEMVLGQRVAERTRELESLLGLARAVASTLELDKLVRLILEELRKAVEYSAASLILLEGDELVVYDLVDEEGRGVLGSGGQVRFRLPSSINGWTALSDHHSSQDYPCVQYAASEAFWTQMRLEGSVIVPDVLMSDGELARDYRANVGDAITSPELASVRSWMAVPLYLQEHLAGYIGIASERPGYFTEKRAQLARAFGDHAGVAIENARLYEQAQRLAVVDERQRLARDLHDSVAQALYGIALGVRTAKKYLPDDPAAAIEPIDYVVSLAAAGLAEMRALIFDLHPQSIEEEGLIKSLKRQVDVLPARHGITVDWQACDEPNTSIEIKEAVYGIVREALHNVVKHSKSDSVTIGIEHDHAQVYFRVADRGIGFDPSSAPAGHLGLQSMAGRAAKFRGTVTVESVPGSGTVVSGSLPLPPRTRP